jgi:Ni/Fe-hydrogenase subunit HybB-like protein
MTSSELENLARIGKLKREPPTDDEIAGLLRSAEERLQDAERHELSYSSRFDLAYNAAHALALVALRRAGYRSNNRYLVFQALAHTVGMQAEKWRILAKAHERRNLAEYEGHIEHDDQLLAELIATANELRMTVGS